MVSEITFFFYKIVHSISSAYLTAYINYTGERSRNTRSSGSKTSWRDNSQNQNFPVFIFPCCIKIWNGLEPNLQIINLYEEFKGKISLFVEIKSNSIFSVHDVYGVGVKLLSRSKLNFSQLNKHKVRHGFKNESNCMRDSGSAKETRLHFFLQCQQQYQTVRLEVLNGIYNVDPKIRNLSNDKLLHLLL